MIWIKALHVLTVFMWIGTLLSLTRLMGYHAKEEVDTQMRLAKLYRRMYFFIELPSMIVAVVTGIILISQLNLQYKPGWFHMKLTFALGLVICDIICGRFVCELLKEPVFGRGIKFKILHGITGLCLIGVIISAIVVRDKKGEIMHGFLKTVSQSLQDGH